VSHQRHGPNPGYRSSTPQYDVFCHICGARWLEQDPEVNFIYAEHVWECADEAACRYRAAELRLLADIREGVTEWLNRGQP